MKTKIIFILLSIVYCISCNTKKEKGITDIKEEIIREDSTSSFSCHDMYNDNFLTCLGIKQKIDVSKEEYYILQIHDGAYKPMLVIYIEHDTVLDFNLRILYLDFHLMGNRDITEDVCLQAITDSLCYKVDVLSTEERTLEKKEVTKFNDFLINDFWSSTSFNKENVSSTSIEYWTIIGFKGNECHFFARYNDKNYANILEPFQNILDALDVEEYSVHQ